MRLPDNMDTDGMAELAVMIESLLVAPYRVFAWGDR
jgi:hypothetical protein